jgi:hypothetical protein
MKHLVVLRIPEIFALRVEDLPHFRLGKDILEFKIFVRVGVLARRVSLPRVHKTYLALHYRKVEMEFSISRREITVITGRIGADWEIRTAFLFLFNDALPQKVAQNGIYALNAPPFAWPPSHVKSNPPGKTSRITHFSIRGTLNPCQYSSSCGTQ